MAIAIKLTDGTTEYDLVGSTYTARLNSLNLGNPQSLVQETANTLRSGRRITRHSFTKRQISMTLSVTAATIAALQTAIENINLALEKARNWGINGVGNRWSFSFDAGTGTPILFTIRDGSLGISPTDINAMRLTSSNPTIASTSLVLDCDPIGVEAAETVSNYISNAGFEIATDLADWTENKTATGTTAVSTSVKATGNESMQLVMTNSGGSGEVIERHQTLADVDAAEVWSFSCKVRVDALSNCKVVMQIDYTGGSPDATAETTTVDNSQFVALSAANLTVPTSTTAAVVRIRLESTAASATGTVYVDDVIAVQASSIPTAWVSGRSIGNIASDVSQATINFVDVHPGPSDMPALVQAKYAEDQTHDANIIGVRHSAHQYDAVNKLWIEAESFTGGETISSGTASAGAYKRFLAVAGVQSHIGSWILFADGGGGVYSQDFDVPTGVAGGILVVGLSGTSLSAVYANSVTYGGQALTQAVAKVNSNYCSTTSFCPYSEIWYLVSPPTGTNTLTLGYPSTPGYNRAAVQAVMLSGCDTTGGSTSNPGNGGGDSAASSTTGDTYSISSGLSAGDLVIAAKWHQADGDPTSGMTLIDGEQYPSYVVFNAAIGHDTNASGSSYTGGLTGYANSGVEVSAMSAFASGGGPSLASPQVFTYDITTPSQGVYRAFGRIASPDGATFAFRMGYSYGGVTVAPTVASDYIQAPGSATGFQWYDLGTIVIPPDRLPENATIGTFQLRFNLYMVSTGGGDDEFQWDCVQLLPMGDNGLEAQVVTKTSAQDVVVTDSISEEPGTTLWNTSDVFQSRPQQTGSVFEIDPDGSRVYYLTQDTNDAPIDDGGKVTMVIQRRHMDVG